MVGSPYLGADSIGAIALTAGVSVAAAISTGGWLTISRLAWATMAGLAVTIGFAVVDLRRPADGAGQPGPVPGRARRRHRRADRAPLQHGQLRDAGQQPADRAGGGRRGCWSGSALLQPWGGLMRLFGIYPAIRAAMAGTAVAAGLGGVLGGSALDVAGAAAALVVPMAALASLRVLDHSTDRTQPGAGRSGDEGPDGRRGGPTDGGRPGGGRARRWAGRARCRRPPTTGRIGELVRRPPDAAPRRTTPVADGRTTPAAEPTAADRADGRRDAPYPPARSVAPGRRRVPQPGPASPRRGSPGSACPTRGAPPDGRCYRGIPWIA